MAYNIDNEFLVIHNAGDKTLKLELPQSESHGLYGRSFKRKV